MTSLLGPPLFGRFDAPPRARRQRILAFSLVLAGLFALLAVLAHAWAAVAVTVVIGFLTGFVVWQYADVRTGYPEALTGRAMAVFTMAMFLGVALVQWLTGGVASAARAAQADAYTAVLLAIAALLVLGALGFRLLPQPASVRH